MNKRVICKNLIIIINVGLFSPLIWVKSIANAAEGDKNPSDGGNIVGPFNPIDSLQFWLCLIAVIFGFLVLIGQYRLISKMSRLTPDDIARNFSLTIVIIGAIVLIVAGYNSQQTAQAFGLFGTIIGYLLGKSSSRNNSQPEQGDDHV